MNAIPIVVIVKTAIAGKRTGEQWRVTKKLLAYTKIKPLMNFSTALTEGYLQTTRHPIVYQRHRGDAAISDVDYIF